MTVDERPRLTLRFPTATLEAAFVRERATASSRTDRAALLLALILVAGLSPLDRWLAPDATGAVWLVRAAVCAWLSVALLVAHAPSMRRHMQVVLVASIAACGLGFTTMALLSSPGAASPYAGMLVPVVLCAHGLVRLPFAVATATSWLVSAAHALLLTSVVGGPATELAIPLVLLAAANTLGMLMSYSRERSERSAFLRVHRLRRQREELRGGLDWEHRLAETLEASELRVRGLLDAVNEGLVAVGGDGCVRWVNRSLTEMMGYTAAELVGHHPTEFLDEDNRRRFVAQFESRRSGSDARYEIDWICKDGSRLTSIVSPHPLFASAGVFQGSVSVLSDVTELKRTERALARSERHFRELVDHACSIILRWGSDGTIRFINPFGARFLGYAEGELVGRNVLGTIVPEEDSTGRDLGEMIRDITHEPERYMHNQNEIRTSDGRRYWVVWTNRALPDSDGRVAEILSIGTDITELKRAREELARQRDELAELNAFIRRVFGRYVSDAVVRSLLESSEGLSVGGSRATVSVLVADIRGFTSICEELTPEQTVSLLNRYLETMTTIVESCEGTIDEIMGDGLLVLFGAPVAHFDHAERAVRCALAMQLGIGEVNRANRARGLPPIEAGIGINTGEVIAGNIGSEKRAKYGVVGTTVNVAARIEACTVGGQILISDATRRAVSEPLVISERIEVEPKGSRRAMVLHEVRGIGGADGLTLPERPSALVTLAEPIPCLWVVLEDKLAGGRRRRGEITRLSARSAELSSPDPVALLDDLKLTLIDDDGRELPGDLYAKVTARTDGRERRSLVQLTARTGAAARHLDRALARAADPVEADERACAIQAD
jgi:PAS domain S-box-containing protein